MKIVAHLIISAEETSYAAARIDRVARSRCLDRMLRDLLRPGLWEAVEDESGKKVLGRWVLDEVPPESKGEPVPLLEDDEDGRVGLVSQLNRKLEDFAAAYRALEATDDRDVHRLSVGSMETMSTYYYELPAHCRTRLQVHRTDDRGEVLRWRKSASIPIEDGPDIPVHGYVDIGIDFDM